MPSTTEAKASMASQNEKTVHLSYLCNFRVEQCRDFLQHKCTQHKPFTCFHWHFQNQRRRRPVRDARTGMFNYSPDTYCNKYDETTGICPDGDECQFLHRTAGDTERRYHLRYYKTGICVYDTDARGNCVKNGTHCAFAHGVNDLRSPVYDVRELHAVEGITDEHGHPTQNGGAAALLGNSLDKERNAVNEDPRWQDTNYVLANYKTEPCKRPPRLCRQGYACPQYHNTRDKRRSPKKFKYRSTPCPSVKQQDEWGDPANCEAADQCPYCHTRTEQQFHPEIYKSTKCNDMQQSGYCPRGPFCAFAHVDKEISSIREMSSSVDSTGTNLAAILNSALPSSAPIIIGSAPNVTSHPSMGQSSMSGSCDMMGGLAGGAGGGGAGATLTHGAIGSSRPRSFSTSATLFGGDHHPPHMLGHPTGFSPYAKAPGCEREDREARKHLQLSGPAGDHCSGPNVGNHNSYGLDTSMFPVNMVNSVVGKAFDDLVLDDLNVEAAIEKDFGLDSDVTPASTIGPRSFMASAPVNIPGRRPMSPSAILGSSLPQNIDKSAFYGSPFAPQPPIGSSSFHQGGGGSATNTGGGGMFNTSSGGGGGGAGGNGPQSQQNAALFSQNGPASSGATGNAAMFSTSAGNGGAGGAGNGNNGSASGGLSSGSPAASGMVWGDLHNGWGDEPRSQPPTTNGGGTSSIGNGGAALEQARAAVDMWKHQAEDAARRGKIIEQQRDSALSQLQQVKSELAASNNVSATRSAMMSLRINPGVLTKNELIQLREQLISDLELVDKALYFHEQHQPSGGGGMQQNNAGGSENTQIMICVLCQSSGRPLSQTMCCRRFHNVCTQCALQAPPHFHQCPYGCAPPNANSGPPAQNAPPQEQTS